MRHSAGTRSGGKAIGRGEQQQLHAEADERADASRYFTTAALSRYTGPATDEHEQDDAGRQPEDEPERRDPAAGRRGR